MPRGERQRDRYATMRISIRQTSNRPTCVCFFPSPPPITDEAGARECAVRLSVRNQFLKFQQGTRIFVPTRLTGRDAKERDRGKQSPIPSVARDAHRTESRRRLTRAARPADADEHRAINGGRGGWWQGGRGGREGGREGGVQRADLSRKGKSSEARKAAEGINKSIKPIESDRRSPRDY
jgi:hypothetical protein